MFRCGELSNRPLYGYKYPLSYTGNSVDLVGQWMLEAKEVHTTNSPYQGRWGNRLLHIYEMDDHLALVDAYFYAQKLQFMDF